MSSRNSKSTLSRLPSQPSSQRPVVLLPTDSYMSGPHRYFSAGEKYIAAVRDQASCLPLLVPGGAVELVDAYLDQADGLLTTGAVSNLEPHHYGESVYDPTRPQDSLRDALSLALLRGAMDRAMPILAICRGFQELNVIHGGSLWQKVHEQGPFADHRARDQDPVQVQYGAAHPVRVEQGLLQELTGRTELQVNSIHEQGIKQLGRGLKPEAFASDGLVEAFSKPQYPNFLLAVQWHPEWQAGLNPDSVAIFTAFGQACEQYQHQQNSQSLQKEPA